MFLPRLVVGILPGQSAGGVVIPAINIRLSCQALNAEQGIGPRLLLGGDACRVCQRYRATGGSPIANGTLPVRQYIALYW